MKYRLFLLLWALVGGIQVGWSQEESHFLIPWVAHPDDHITRAHYEYIRFFTEEIDLVDPENVRALQPSATEDDFYRTIDDALEKLAGQDKPNLDIVINSHGKAGWVAGSSCRASHTNLVDGIVSRIQNFQKRNGPVVLNLIVDTCYSGSFIETFKSKIDDGMNIRANLFATSTPDILSHGSNGYRTIQNVRGSLSADDAKVICPNCTEFQRFSKVIETLKPSKGMNGDIQMAWSSYVDYNQWTSSEMSRAISRVGNQSVAPQAIKKIRAVTPDDDAFFQHVSELARHKEGLGDLGLNEKQFNDLITHLVENEKWEAIETLMSTDKELSGDLAKYIIDNKVKSPSAQQLATTWVLRGNNIDGRNYMEPLIEYLGPKNLGVVIPKLTDGELFNLVGHAGLERVFPAAQSDPAQAKRVLAVANGVLARPGQFHVHAVENYNYVKRMKTGPHSEQAAQIISGHARPEVDDAFVASSYRERVGAAMARNDMKELSSIFRELESHGKKFSIDHYTVYHFQTEIFEYIISNKVYGKSARKIVVDYIENHGRPNIDRRRALGAYYETLMGKLDEANNPLKAREIQAILNADPANLPYKDLVTRYENNPRGLRTLLSGTEEFVKNSFHEDKFDVLEIWRSLQDIPPDSQAYPQARATFRNMLNSGSNGMTEAIRSQLSIWSNKDTIGYPEFLNRDLDDLASLAVYNEDIDKLLATIETHPNATEETKAKARQARLGYHKDLPQPRVAGTFGAELEAGNMPDPSPETINANALAGFTQRCRNSLLRLTGVK